MKIGATWYVSSLVKKEGNDKNLETSSRGGERLVS